MPAAARSPCRTPNPCRRARARCGSTSPTPASAAPTCTSCTATWTTGSACPAVIGHEMSGRVAAVGAGRRRTGPSVTPSPSCRCAGTARAPPAWPDTSTSATGLTFIGIDSPGVHAAAWTVPARLARAAARRPALDHGRAGRADRGRGARRAPLRARPPASTPSSSAAGRSACSIGMVAQPAGADVTVLELDPHRRAVAADLGLAAVDPPASTWPHASSAGPAGPAPTSSSRSPAPPAASAPPPTCSRSAAGWSSSRSTRSPARSTCTGSSGGSYDARCAGVRARRLRDARSGWSRTAQSRPPG